MCLKILSQIINLKALGLEINKLYEVDVKDDKERFKAQRDIRQKVEMLGDLKTLFYNCKWIDKNDDSEETYRKMYDQILFILGNQDDIIKDYMSKDRDLCEFLAVHGDDNIRAKYVPGVLQQLKKKVISISAKEKELLNLIKVFDGRPIKYQEYPIKITFDRGIFMVEDTAFSVKIDNRMEQWRNAPVFVL